MREGKFIDKNWERWNSYLEHTNQPDELADRFVNLVDDLSFAQTYYPNTKTTQFINGITAKMFQSIYQKKQLKYSTIGTFWKYELPLLFKKYHNLFFFSMFLFTLAFCIGWLACIHDPHFIRTILGDSYVEMTEENILKGDPFGVYKNGNEFGMFMMIAINNIKVSFMAFVMGIFACVGTVYILFYNGIMLGCFQYLFYMHHLGMKSILVIWIHGTIEISSIIIAGTAGLILGTSLLFPKTYSRIESLKMGAKDAVKIIFGLIPFFLLAAFFEGFITRHTQMPLPLSILILVLSAITIVFYFMVYPILLSRTGLYIQNGKMKFTNNE